MPDGGDGPEFSGTDTLSYIQKSSRLSTTLEEDKARIAAIREVKGTASSVLGAERALHEAGDPEKNAIAQKKAQDESARLRARSAELELARQAREGNVVIPDSVTAIGGTPNMNVIRPLNPDVRIEPTSVGPIPDDGDDAKESAG